MLKTTKLKSECVDIATGETNPRFLFRVLENEFKFYVTLDNFPRVFDLNGPQAKDCIHKDYKAYASKNNIPNYILDYEDPQTQKGRKNTAFAPAEHVLGFLRNRKSTSAIDLVKRIDDEIARRTHSIQLRDAEDRVDVETQRANEAERCAKEEAIRAKEEAIRAKESVATEQAARMEAEKRAEEEADRADAECEMRLEQEKAAAERIQATEQRLLVAAAALKQLPEDAQIACFGEKKYYDLACSKTMESGMEHARLADRVEEHIKDIYKIFKNMNIVHTNGFKVAVDQSMSIMHRKVMRDQVKCFGPKNTMALLGSRSHSGKRSDKRIGNATNHKLSVICEELVVFKRAMQKNFRRYTENKITETCYQEDLRDDFSSLDCQLLKLVDPVGSKAGHMGHNSGAYGAIENQEKLTENTVRAPVVVATLVTSTGEIMGLRLTQAKRKGKDDEEKAAYQQICGKFLSDDTLVWSRDETLSERNERRHRLMMLFQAHLPVKKWPPLNHIDSKMRKLIYGETMKLPMHNEMLTFSNFVDTRLSHKVDLFMRSSTCRQSLCITEGYCKGISHYEYNQKKSEKVKLGKVIVNEKHGRSPKRHRNNGVILALLGPDQIAHLRQEEEEKLTKLKFKLKFEQKKCNIPYTMCIERLRCVKIEPPDTFAERCLVEADAFNGRDTTIKLFRKVLAGVDFEKNDWFDAKKQRPEYMGDKEAEIKEFVKNTKGLFDAWRADVNHTQAETCTVRQLEVDEKMKVCILSDISLTPSSKRSEAEQDKEKMRKIQKLLGIPLSRHGRERGALTNLIKRIDDMYSDSFVIPDEWKRYCASGSSGVSSEFAGKHGIEKPCDIRRAKKMKMASNE